MWTLIFTILDGFLDKFDEIRLFYGISGWDLIIISVVLGDLAIIIRAIFQSDPAEKG